MAGMKGVGTFSLVVGPHGNIRETLREVGNLQGYINKIKKEVGELYDLWDILANTILSSVQERFDTGGGEKKWKRLEDYTIKKRKLLGTWPGPGNQPILVETGRLMESIRIMRKTPSSLKIGSTVPYAYDMQDGIIPNPAFPTWRDIPARPFLYFSKSDLDAIDTEIRRFIDDLISKGASENLSIPF